MVATSRSTRSSTPRTSMPCRRCCSRTRARSTRSTSTRRTTRGANDWKYNNDYVDADDAYRALEVARVHGAAAKVGPAAAEPGRSALIVTIDEKEVLAWTAPGADLPRSDMQMVTFRRSVRRAPSVQNRVLARRRVHLLRSPSVARASTHAKATCSLPTSRTWRKTLTSRTKVSREAKSTRTTNPGHWSRSNGSACGDGSRQACAEPVRTSSTRSSSSPGPAGSTAIGEPIGDDVDRHSVAVPPGRLRCGR